DAMRDRSTSRHRLHTLLATASIGRRQREGYRDLRPGTPPVEGLSAVAAHGRRGTPTRRGEHSTTPAHSMPAGVSRPPAAPYGTAGIGQQSRLTNCARNP